MILFKINNINYKIFEHWREMPLSIGCAIHTLCFNEMPSKIKDIYSIITGTSDDKEKQLVEWYNSITDEEMIKTFPAFYGKVIKLLTDIPEDVIAQIKSADRDVFYKQYCEKFVFGIIYAPTDFDAVGIKSFKHKDLPELFLPITKSVMGVDKPMFDRTAIEFTESADLEIFSKQMAGGKFEVAANIISILCRPIIPNKPMEPFDRIYTSHGVPRKLTGKERMALIVNYPRTIIEPYNEDVCLERAKQLADVPMNIVFEVFFCLAKLIPSSSQTMTTSSAEGMRKEERQSKKVA